jgi:hypothetical protein
MSALLKAMGVTIWGLIGIALVFSLVVFGFRASLLYRDARIRETPATNSSAESDTSFGLRPENRRASPNENRGADAAGIYSSERAARATRTLLRQAAENQQYERALEYGNALSDSGSAEADDLVLMAQTYAALRACNNADAWVDRAISTLQKAGKTPTENLYLLKVHCSAGASDNAGTIAALEALIRMTNKSEYWNLLTRILRAASKDDHDTLMVYRVMYNTNSMSAGSDYIEMSQLLSDAALPVEAQAVLEGAVRSDLIKDEQKERTMRTLNSLAMRLAGVGSDGIAAQQAKSLNSEAGEADLRLGELYYGLGDYRHAAASIDRAFAKGRIQHLDDAYVYLGLAQAALHNGAAARKAFAGLAEAPNVNSHVLALWRLYAETRILQATVGST